MPDITCTFSIDDKNQKILREIAEANHRSLSGQIRLILEEFIEKEIDKK